MKRATTLFQPLSILLATSILFASCSSTTLLTSSPSGAKVYLNGQSVGTTPYSHSDTRIVDSRTDVRLVLEGYEPLYTTFARDDEFGGVGIAVKAIRRGLLNLLPEQTDKLFTSRLMKVVKEINRRDYEGIRGKRAISFTSN